MSAAPKGANTLQPIGPVSLFESLKAASERDREGMALAVFNELDHLGPMPVPPPKRFSDPSAYTRWRTEAVPIPEGLVPEFCELLEYNRFRTRVIEENVRRLRSTTWAECELRKLGKTDYAVVISQFHRTQWGIRGGVRLDEREREAQVQAVARNGRA